MRIIANALNQIRDNLRTDFKGTSLEQSMDKRNVIQTAHSTIFRLKERIENKESFLDIVEKYKDHYFGSFTVNSLVLVYNDWYQRKEFVKELYRFELE